jgi:dephospho-CoA kinase
LAGTTTQVFRESLPVNPGKPIIGLTGGIGSGKSTVASIMGDLGAAVIDADRLNHEELEAPEVIETLQQWWGEEIVGQDGGVDRSEIRRRIAGSPEQRQRLEQLVHPRIARRIDQLTREYGVNPQVRAIVWDIPLLCETGAADRCDCVVFVQAERHCRQARALGRKPWSEADFIRMEAAQWPIERKQARADFVIENSSTRADLQPAVEEVFQTIIDRYQHRAGGG